ncbi:hemerythrin domain-containing protein [Streptomyces finlayi]|uniref:Hemerythrin domain-containing protein n=1 Tax=Streptomyces finlayi TaxID=67296 RepID=A0A7G7BDN2_9ACTN|nr:hemerythrin domain-containing protein [Streptomyces finlayi]QNE73447.1 hemerythrin domain-containing protein [Streptomyces finlayi]
MTHGTGVIAEIRADHREAQERIARLEALPVEDLRCRALADELTALLVRTAVAEETHVYPVVRERLGNGRELADQEVSAHTRIEEILKELEDLEADDPRFTEGLSTLKSVVSAQALDEEVRLLPELARACSEQELNTLGQLVRRTKETAPTRPHPSLPTAPPAITFVAPGVGFVDRLRDTLSGRPH